MSFDDKPERITGKSGSFPRKTKDFRVLRNFPKILRENPEGKNQSKRNLFIECLNSNLRNICWGEKMNIPTSELKDKKVIVRYGSIANRDLVYVCLEGESSNHTIAQEDAFADYRVITAGATSAIIVTERKNLENGLAKIKLLKLLSPYTMKNLAVDIKPEGLLIGDKKTISDSTIGYAAGRLKEMGLDKHSELWEEDDKFREFFARILVTSVQHVNAPYQKEYTRLEDRLQKLL